MKIFTCRRQLMFVVCLLLGCLSMQAADDGLITEQVTLNGVLAGSLPTIITDDNKNLITNLKINGEINGTDLKFIREMAGRSVNGDETEGKLSILDLSDTKIVSGGKRYFHDMVNGASYFTKDDEIGDNAFYQCRGKPYHIMFMPCSNWIKYEQRFKRLNWYMGKHRPDLTSGLYDTVICDARESLHEADGADSRVLERNYEITGDIKGKEIIIIDDVLTTGQSVSDYKEEIERHGGKVVAAIFYGKTFSMPPMSVVRMSVWGDSISHAIKGRKKS